MQRLVATLWLMAMCRCRCDDEYTIYAIRIFRVGSIWIWIYLLCCVALFWCCAVYTVAFSSHMKWINNNWIHNWLFLIFLFSIFMSVSTHSTHTHTSTLKRRCIHLSKWKRHINTTRNDTSFRRPSMVRELLYRLFRRHTKEMGILIDLFCLFGIFKWRYIILKRAIYYDIG